MSSESRHIKRRAVRKNGGDWPDKAQTTIVKDDHYLVLRPTKGFLRVSVKRLAAQAKMADLLQGRGQGDINHG